MPTLLEMWLAVIMIFICGMMIGFEIRRLQDEKKKNDSSLSPPQFLGVNCGHQILPIIDTCYEINPCVEEAHRLHEENLRKYRETFNYRTHNAPEGRIKKTVYIQCRNGRPVSMKEIYNGKGV